MKRNVISKLIFMAIFATTSIQSQASVVWDWSPRAAGTGIASDHWSNWYSSQHFAEKVSFQRSMHIDGMDIYSYSGATKLGLPVKITIWNDNAGQPGSMAAQFTTSLSAVDTVGAVSTNQRSYADFVGFDMAAGLTYWIGMAGDGVGLAQTGLKGVAGGDGTMAYFSKNSFNGLPYYLGDMAFRLHGDPVQGNTVPEPGTLLLLTLGAAVLRARQQGKTGARFRATWRLAS